MVNQHKIPLLEALREHDMKEPVSFHVPGHKNGSVFPDEGKDLFQSILSADVTELTGLDDLHAPEGPIKEAEELLSSLYRAKESHFLVNGTTSGNLAMILGSCMEGDTVIVQRNCHKSILHGIMLANARPVFISPVYDEIWNVPTGITFERVNETLRSHPDTKAIILTYPNYYGTGEDVSRIIELAHRHGIPVLVDEAHGAHFVLGRPFPVCALAAGADIVVQSAHKTLPAMTMGSYIHFNSDIIDKSKVRFYLQVVQSSSPSYPIMASLDLARYYIASLQQQELSGLFLSIKSFRRDIERIEGIKVLEAGSGIADPLKVTIRSSEGFSGYDVQAALERQNIFTELADPFNVLFIMPLSHKADHYERVLAGIEKGIKDVSGIKYAFSPNKPLFTAETGKLEMSYKQMNITEKKEVFIKESEGMIAAESIIPYPPGIPLLLKGERISDYHIEQLNSYKKLGARFHGGEKLAQNKVIVFK